MRDHRRLSDRLRTRWLRRQPPPGRVTRMFAGISAPHFTSVRNLYANAHAHVVFTSATAGLRTTHTAARAAVTTRPPITIDHLVHTAVHVGAHGRQPASSKPPAVTAVQRAARTGPRQSRTATARREIRVADVARVLPKPGGLRAGADQIGAETAPLRPKPMDPHPVTRSAAAPTPFELTTITNQVLTEIDRRLIAHNERLGRG
ncbi:MAG TPA: hypothetical protein VH496_01940 [Mycobacterium sp.]|jgi:hypothetical protein